MLEELMPPLMAFTPQEGWSGHTEAQPRPENMRVVATALLLASAGAGRKDRKSARRILDLITARNELEDKSPHTRDESGRVIWFGGDADAEEADITLIRQIHTEIRALQRRLENKVL